MPERVLIIGAAASGKSTLARAVVARTGLPHLHLDQLRWDDDFQERPDSEDAVRRAAAADRWVAEAWWLTERRFRGVAAALLERADLVVWHDMPRSLVIRRALSRSWREATKGQDWTGQRIRFRVWLLPDYPVLLSLVRFDEQRLKQRRLLRTARGHVVHLRSQPATDAWAAGLVAEAPAG